MLPFILGLVEYIAPFTMLVTAATAITVLTPTKIDDKYNNILLKGLNVLLRILNIFAGNVLRNRNKDDK